MNSINAITLDNEVNWFNQVLEARIGLYFEHDDAAGSIYDLTPPDLSEDGSPYAQMINENHFGFDERIVLVLALIPHVRPQLLDTLFIRNKNLDRGYTEFGGWKGGHHGGFLPTCETAAFILAGDELEKRFQVMEMFESEHPFSKRTLVSVRRHDGDEPFFSGALLIAQEILGLCTTGIRHKPDYSTHFPAKRITTRLSWDDLVVAPQVRDELESIKTWIKYSSTIMDDWGMAKDIKPGYRTLFYGPPGTGKTLTASLIGAEVGADVYRIDLSMLVSKYIGETEKNLANVFDQAQNKNWILFFDEADALFGKRTSGSSANDRYANQEVSYLLQRIEDFPGVVILATNLKANIDEAFARRFQSAIYFPMPDAGQRYQLWYRMLQGRYDETQVDALKKISASHELSGGAIINVVRAAAISTLRNGREHIGSDDLLLGVAKELRKEGRTI